MALAGKIKDLFHNEGIHSTTIQPEFSEVFSFDYNFIVVKMLF
jgi:zinc transporter 1